MLILDTNHYSEFERASVAGARLRQRLEFGSEIAALTVVTIQEVIRGRMHSVHLASGLRLVAAYEQFHQSVVLLAGWLTLPWSNGAERIVGQLSALKLRIGTQDLRIAAIALEHEATILTRNLVDFQKVPGLKVENWLD